MKSLLSILCLLTLAGYSKAENFDNKAKLEQVWFSDETFQNSVVLELVMFDEQESNELTGPDLFYEDTASNLRTYQIEVKRVYVILPCREIQTLQYSLIDLPPPSFSITSLSN